MTKSGIAELRRLLRTRNDCLLRHRFFTEATRGMYQDTCNWLVADTGFWGEQIVELSHSELRQFLTFVLYAETDK